MVVSTVIDKYIYITVNKKFDNLIRASYSITEFVEKPQDLKHELIREALIMLEIDGGIEITSISDIPSTGTGLGSSSTYTVGLLKALHAYKGEFVSSQKLAEEACEIEINRCHKPIGKQDQYIASFGNLNSIQFLCNGDVLVDPIICRPETKKKLEENLLMLYTKISRPSSSILATQSKKMVEDSDKRKIMSDMVILAQQLRISLESNNLEDFGNLLHQNWELKKQITEEISNPQIDKWYNVARENGALGGKILGAGGGGFLLLYAPKEKHEDIRAALPELRYTKFSFDQEGSKIIYFGEK
jgi:D-glycero-alpha-D-manno-heptose-7-phosphate kinase